MAARLERFVILSDIFNKTLVHVQMLMDYRSHTASTAVEGKFQEDQSIASLAGTYADAPFMENFPEFLEEYRSKINRLNEE
jgi:hypothetical protein